MFAQFPYICIGDALVWLILIRLQYSALSIFCVFSLDVFSTCLFQLISGRPHAHSCSSDIYLNVLSFWYCFYNKNTHIEYFSSLCIFLKLCKFWSPHKPALSRTVRLTQRMHSGPQTLGLGWPNWGQAKQGDKTQSESPPGALFMKGIIPLRLCFSHGHN